MLIDSIKFFSASIIGCLLLMGISDIRDSVSYAAAKNHPIELRLYASQIPSESDTELCLSQPQCRKLAEAIFFESRGEPQLGQYAVAFAIINRRDNGRWPDTVSGVVDQRINGTCQFSYICQLDQRLREQMIAKRQSVWEGTLQIAHDVYYFAVPDLTEGADHFYNPQKVPRTPKFARVYEYVATIGDHKFYRSE